MQMNESIDVIECFKKLQQSLYQLAPALYHDIKLPLWLNNSKTVKATRQQVYHTLNQIEYTDHQDSRCTIQLPGIVGASNETLQLINFINTLKDDFKVAIQKLKKEKGLFSDKVLQHNLQELLNKRHPYSHATLQQSGLSRLHLKQCYRHIPTLTRKPEKVSWTWAHTRAIKRITVTEAKKVLLKKQHLPGIESQLQKLQNLAANEPLAIVQNLAPHVRANITTKLQDGELKRHMLSAALPIFYPENAKGSLPAVSHPGIKQGKSASRLTRSDQKLCDEVFLPALRAHRYKSSL